MSPGAVGWGAAAALRSAQATGQANKRGNQGQLRPGAGVVGRGWVRDKTSYNADVKVELTALGLGEGDSCGPREGWNM